VTLNSFKGTPTMSPNVIAKTAAEQDKAHHVHPMTNPVSLRECGPEMVMSADGVYLYLDNGRRLIDLHSSLANVNIGYGNPDVCAAGYKALQSLSYGHTIAGRSNPWAAALGAKLAEITPHQYQHFFFASSGSEANETAVKIALYYWRLRGKDSKRAIISRRGSYHGGTLFTSSLTNNWDPFHTQFGLPISNLIHHTRSTNWYTDGKDSSPEEFALGLLADLEKKILEIGPSNVAAFIGETLQTPYIVPHALYWPGVRQLCDRYDILLIADEIVSGFGKTGKMFGFENFSFEPDLFTMAKGLTSGYFPLSAVAICTKVAEVMQHANEMFAHVFTNSGHPVGAAIALANLAVIEDQGLLAKVRDVIGPHLRRRLQEIALFPFVGEVRQSGVMAALEIDLSRVDPSANNAKNDVLQATIAAIAWRKGAFVRAGSLLCLPMIITEAQIDDGIDILKESMVEAQAGIM
jgi:putrescine aminotransferase